MAETEKKTAYFKVTIDTPLFIDFDYWKSKEENWRTLLSGYLCDEQSMCAVVVHINYLA